MIHKTLTLTLLAGIVLMLAACGSSSVTDQQPVPTKQLAAHSVTLAPAAVNSNMPVDSFHIWLQALRQEALARGISPQVFDNAYMNISAPSAEVLQRDQTQPEATQTFAHYMDGFVSEKKVTAAREQWQSHTGILHQVQSSYGVPVPTLLALWQTESRFGENQGSFSIIESLTTLAYDGRRSVFFRKELLDALLILQQEHMDAAQLTGSWAGAMGEDQFMPSSFLAYAVDFDGDGRRDIWNDDADALASMANYLKSKGWDNTIGWGMHVRVPHGTGTLAWVKSKERHSFAEWRRLGLRSADGSRLPEDIYLSRLVIPDNDPQNAYLVTSNYDVIMDWNHSVYFATGVCLLADAIAAQ